MAQSRCKKQSRDDTRMLLTPDMVDWTNSGVEALPGIPKMTPMEAARIIPEAWHGLSKEQERALEILRITEDVK